MIRINFSNDDMNSLFELQQNHPCPKVRRKLLAVYLKSQGVEHEAISRICRITWPTMTSYFNEYLTNGLSEVAKTRYVGRPSKLASHRDEILANFQEKPPATVKEACARIANLTGLERSIPQVWAFLRKNGLRTRKVGGVPGRADPAAQEDFKKKELEPRLAEAVEGKRVVYFSDAAHFVLSPLLGFLWSLTRIFIKTPAGRSRLNVLGAINAVTHDLVTVVNDTFVNADTVRELLYKLALANPTKPVTVVLDNARYQRCEHVMGYAVELGIELLFLPSYSPNLNLIERLWKLVKKKCLYSQYYSNFSEFKSAIVQCVTDMPTKHAADLRSLMTLNQVVIPRLCRGTPLV